MLNIKIKIKNSHCACPVQNHLTKLSYLNSDWYLILATFLLKTPRKAARLQIFKFPFFGSTDNAPPKFVSYLSTFEQLILIRNITPSIYSDIPEYKQSF